MMPLSQVPKPVESSFQNRKRYPSSGLPVPTGLFQSSVTYAKQKNDSSTNQHRLNLEGNIEGPFHDTMDLVMMALAVVESDPEQNQHFIVETNNKKCP